MGESLPNHHEDHDCRKREQFTAALQFGSQICSYASSHENSSSKGSSGQGMGKLEKISAWNLMKVRNKIRGDRWSRDEGRKKFILPHWWTSVIWRMPNWRQSTKNTKDELYSRGDIVKDDSGSYAVFTRTRIISITNDSSKSHGYHLQTAVGCDGQAADAVSAHTQVKMEDAPKLLKIPKSECPYTWIRLPRHKLLKSWSSMEDPVVPLERTSVRSFGRTIMGEAIWENSIETRLGEGFQIGNACSYTVKKGCSYQCMWMT